MSRTRSPSPWSFRVELPLALVVGAVAAWGAWAWLSRFHLAESITAADFFDYCTGVVSLLDDDPSIWPLKRSRAAAWPAAAFAPEHGVFDGLLLGALVGTALCFAGLHLWASALAGRAAGLAAVALGLSMSPLALQTRMVSTYPVLNAGLCWAAAGVAVAARTRSPAGFALAGLGVGWALVSDARGLVWALPCLGVALTVAVFAKTTARGRATALLALLLPVAASYPVGSAAFPEEAYTLEEQIDVRPLYHLHGSRTKGFTPPFTYDSGWVWGHTPVRELPKTLRFLVDNARLPMPDDVEMHTPQGLMERQVEPWLTAAAWLAPAALLGLWATGRRWAAWGLVGGALPYLVALHGMQGMVELYPRFLTQALPGVAACGGIAFGLVWSRLPWRRIGRIGGASIGPAVGWIAAAALWAALTLGAVPSPLSPTADWRLSWAPVLDEAHAVGQDLRSPTGSRPGAPQARCVAALRADRARLGEQWSRRVPFDHRQQTDYRHQLSSVPPAHDPGQTSGGPPRVPPGDPPAGRTNGP